MRVDGVEFKIYDTRMFHEFSEDYVLREFKQGYASYDELKNRLPSQLDLSPLLDSNWVSSNIKTYNVNTELAYLPTKS